MSSDRIVARYALGPGTWDVLTRDDYEALCRRIRADPGILDRLLMYVAQLDAQLKTDEGLHARNNDPWVFPLYAEFHNLLADHGEQRAGRMTTMALPLIFADVRSGAFFDKN